MAVTHDVNAVFDDRQPTDRARQTMIIAATIPFAIVAPPLAGVILGSLVLLRWDLRREPVWWGLVACGYFLPWLYIIIALVFLAFGGTKPRPRANFQPVR